jgi:hypothetical protein
MQKNRLQILKTKNCQISDAKKSTTDFKSKKISHQIIDIKNQLSNSGCKKLTVKHKKINYKISDAKKTRKTKNEQTSFDRTNENAHKPIRRRRSRPKQILAVNNETLICPTGEDVQALLTHSYPCQKIREL